MFLEQLTDKGFRLTRPRAIPDRNGFDTVSADQVLHDLLGTGDVLPRHQWIDRRIFQKLAGLIHDSELTARTQAWINAEDAIRPERWGHQEVPQVPLEHGDGFSISPFFERSAHLGLQ